MSETEKGFCDVCGRKIETYKVILAEGTGVGDYCIDCAKENDRQFVE